jgi:hypothetical protein
MSKCSHSWTQTWVRAESAAEGVVWILGCFAWAARLWELASAVGLSVSRNAGKALGR